MITGDITPAEWAHFCTFTARVRRLAYDSEGPLHVDPLVWTILARKCRGEPLLPRLRLIEALEINNADVPALVSFLTPILRDVTVWFRGAKGFEPASEFCTSVKVLFQTLVCVTPHLTALDWGAPYDRCCGTDFLASIGCLRNLSSLRLHGKTSDTPSAVSTQVPIATLLWEITTITPLVSLSLNVELFAGPNGALTAVAGSTLPALHTLEVCITNGPAEMLATFVHSLRLPALQSLVVDTRYSPLGYSTLEDQLPRICANLPSLLREFH